jgi:trimethylamine-N-oxide reductase cytochrome c-type subunit TorC
MMNLLKKSLIVCLISLSSQAANYIHVEEGVELPLPDGTIVYSGIPVEIVSKDTESAITKISGFVEASDKTKLYATKNLKLLLASSKNIKIDGDKGSLEMTIPVTNLTDDMELAWENSADTYYKVCSKCHAGKVVEHHSMIEWEALYGSMKVDAKPTKEQTNYILRYVRAFANDGILKEDY